ncbi:MAG TPA: hypothetical protein ENK18_17035 [Deltaproteobacteria bacterium]|nr:hypothetical protein [Deltaproteobacteria bacterium]
MATRYLDRLARFAGCTSEVDWYLGSGNTYSYDTLGYLSAAGASAPDGTPIAAYSYTWDLDDRSMPIRSDWTDAIEGWYGHTTYDPNGRPLEIFGDYGSVSLTTELTHTYDSDGWLIASEQHDEDRVISTTYNGCEDPILRLSDPDGGASIDETTIVWTYSSGCLPQTAVYSYNYRSSVYTEHFDAQGRTTHTVLSESGEPDQVSTWSWSCP